MRIINITVSSKEIPVISIDSFGVHEEQLVDEVVEQAEKLYIKKAKELNIDEVEAEESLEDGYILDNKGNAVSIVWSDIS